jgi:DNA modification methylase
MQEASRLLRPDGYLYTTLGKGYIMAQAFIAAENAGFKTRPFSWIKPNPMPNGPNTPWKSNIDQCLFAYRKLPAARRYDKCGRRNYVRVDVPRGKYRVHPTQKPVRLFQYWLKQTPGRVLDPFCGVGSSGLAAQRLGLDWVGVEISPEYAKEAARRLRYEREVGAFYT